MRRRLASATTAVGAVTVVAALVTGCGAETVTTSDPGAGASASSGAPTGASTRVSDPPSDPPSDPGSGSSSASGAGGPVRYTVVDVVTQTMGGGEVSPVAAPVPDADAARGFAAQFGDSGLVTRVVQAVERADLVGGQALYAAVVGIGCSAPAALEVGRSADGYTVEAAGESKPGIQCLAPMTSVALVAIDG